MNQHMTAVFRSRKSACSRAHTIQNIISCFKGSRTAGKRRFGHIKFNVSFLVSRGQELQNNHRFGRIKLKIWFKAMAQTTNQAANGEGVRQQADPIFRAEAAEVLNQASEETCARRGS